MRRRLALAALGALAILCMAPFGPTNSRSVPTEGASPPADTTVSWVDPVTLAQFYYSTTAGVWLSPVSSNLVGKNASGVTGALGIGLGAFSCDTTTASAEGLWSPDSTILTGISWTSSRYTATAPNCTTQVYKIISGPTLVLQTVWAGEMGDSTLATPIYFGSYEPIAIYLKPKSAAAVNPGQPQMVFRLYKFRRKT